MHSDSSGFKYDNIDLHKFVDDMLAASDFRIRLITKEVMEERLDDFVSFVNGIRTEYSDLYGWSAEPREYFLNALTDKWKYSYFILNNANEICFIGFSSLYGDRIHHHCSYARSDLRGFNLAKLHMIKLCQTALDSGFTNAQAYWPKTNNGSIILYLKMGWQIDSIRNNKELFMTANLPKVRNRTYDLLMAGK